MTIARYGSDLILVSLNIYYLNLIAVAIFCNDNHSTDREAQSTRSDSNQFSEPANNTTPIHILQIYADLLGFEQLEA